MKLLLDETLSRRPVPFLQAEFPDSTQVALAGLERATDLAIWAHARNLGYIIVTRNADFEELSTLHCCPPRYLDQGREYVESNNFESAPGKP